MQNRFIHATAEEDLYTDWVSFVLSLIYTGTGRVDSFLCATRSPVDLFLGDNRNSISKSPGLNDRTPIEGG